VTKTSLESTAQDDDIQEVKRRKRHISNDTLETAKKSYLVMAASAQTAQKTKAEEAEAYCRQAAGTLKPGIGPRWDPWPYICSMLRPLFCFVFPFVDPPY
jgi:hypothetical protein